MSISCRCLNVIVKLAGWDTESLPQFDVKKYLQKCSHQSEQAASKSTPSDDHFLFFKEALGPVQCSDIKIQFDFLLRVTREFNEWDLIECHYCNCCVYAQNIIDGTTSSGSYLVNSTLMTNQEQLSARVNDENYSPAFGIILDRSNLSYSDLAEKGRLLNKTKVDNKFVRLIRSYMEQETQASNERIQRFTEQEFAVLKVKRERAEQDCLILSKLENKVPELLHTINSSSNSNSTTSNVGTAEIGEHPIMTTNPITRSIGMISSNNVSPMVTTGVPSNLNDTSSGSQLETPPPTPEYLPMSTGNSPPMTSAANNRQQAITPSSSSSMSTSDQQISYSSPNTKYSGIRSQNKANFNYNGNNNNNIVSLNNTRGAINNKPPPPATTMLLTSPTHKHSSTNSIQMQQQQRMTTTTTSSFESDCMFDIDGMENDKSPLSNTLSDEEELAYDESSGNNNEDGVYIPSRQFGRQNSSIAKSLPISMPQVMTQFRTNDEDFEETAEDNVDIAASIKALAKSVHGDTVFGDLPRPQIQRFSTQI